MFIIIQVNRNIVNYDAEIRPLADSVASVIDNLASSCTVFDSVVPKDIRYYKVLLLYVLAVAITLLASFIYLAIKNVILRTISKYHAKKPTLQH